MNDLEHGRACHGRRAWREAYDALERADEATPLDGDDLDRLTTAACLSGRETEFLRLLERQFRSHGESGTPTRAARCAFWLALTFLTRGDVVKAGGPSPEITDLRCPLFSDVLVH